METKIVFYDHKMVVHSKSKKVAYYYCELKYVKYEKPYCTLHFKNHPTCWAEISIKTMIEHLPESAFLMCKRSAIVNLCHLGSFDNSPPTIVMEDGVKFPLSRANTADLSCKLEKIEDISPSCPDCFVCKSDCKKQPLFCRRNNAESFVNPS